MNDHPNHTILRRNLVYLRHRACCTQTQIAQELDILRVTLGAWECAQNWPPVPALIKLADRYGVTLDQLLREDLRLNPLNPTHK